MIDPLSGKVRGRFRYESMILLQNLVYAIMDPVIKIAYRSVPVYSFMTMRYIVTFSFFFLVFGKRLLPDLKSAPARTCLTPSMCTAASFISYNMALDLTAATHAAFLQSLKVTFVPLILLLFRHERVTRKDLLVQTGAVIGLYLLCMGGSGLGSLGGNLLALASGVFAAVAAITTPWALRHVGVPTLSFMNAVCSLALSAGAGLFSGVFAQTDWEQALSPRILAIVLFAGLVASCGGYLLQNTAQRHLSPKTVSVLQCSYPVLTTVVAFFVLSETLSLRGLLGAVMLTACMVAESLHK